MTLAENTVKIQNAYNSSNIVEFRKAIEETESFEKLKGRENFKTLVGTEKQVAWASEIREKLVSQFSYEKCCLAWDMNAQKRGEKGMGDKTMNFELAIKNLNKKYAFLFQESAVVIIENRNI